jgi:hypothetical protein
MTKSTETHETAPTQFVQGEGVRFAHRRFGRRGQCALLFLNYLAANMDDWDPTFYCMVRRASAILSQSRDTLEQEETIAILLDTILREHVREKRPSDDVIGHVGVRYMRDIIHDCFDQNLSLAVLASHARRLRGYPGPLPRI